MIWLVAAALASDLTPGRTYWVNPVATSERLWVAVQSDRKWVGGVCLVGLSSIREPAVKVCGARLTHRSEPMPREIARLARKAADLPGGKARTIVGYGRWVGVEERVLVSRHRFPQFQVSHPTWLVLADRWEPVQYYPPQGWRHCGKDWGQCRDLRFVDFTLPAENEGSFPLAGDASGTLPATWVPLTERLKQAVLQAANGDSLSFDQAAANPAPGAVGCWMGLLQGGGPFMPVDHESWSTTVSLGPDIELSLETSRQGLEVLLQSNNQRHRATLPFTSQDPCPARRGFEATIGATTVRIPADPGSSPVSHALTDRVGVLRGPPPP